MGRFRTSWKLAVAAVLMVLQAGILAIGLFAPRVSPGYRAFFIDHSSDIWPAPKLVPETSVAISTPAPPPPG
jgi:hypothetical protein